MGTISAIVEYGGGGGLSLAIVSSEIVSVVDGETYKTGLWGRRKGVVMGRVRKGLGRENKKVGGTR